MKENYNEKIDDLDYDEEVEAIKPDEEIEDGDKISEEKRVKNFETFKKFLKTDMRIKENLIRVAPAREDDYNEESRIEYTDKLDSLLKDFKVEFELISEGFEFGETVSNAINNFFKKARENLAVGKYESGVGNDLYQQNFSNMRPELVDEVKKRCKGYTCATPERLADLMSKATSVNEMLHVMHSFVMNNEQIMSSMPKLGEKKNAQGYPITLYGEPSAIADEIFEKFPNELDVGWTDIISMQNKVCMMVRDRGHALTIDMDTSKEEEIGVKYFIPKLCNEEMIMALKGIDKANITNDGARGSFTAKKEEITEELFGFIEKVPTDADMPRPNWDEIFASIRAEQAQKRQEEMNQAQVPIQSSQENVFSADQAKELAMEPERRIGKIEKLQNAIVKLFSPLINKFKRNENQNLGTKSDLDEQR